MVFLSFMLLLALSALLAFGFAFYALRRQETPGARPFVLILLGHGLSAAWYACELIADSLTWKIVWDNLQFTSLDMIVVGYLWFALEYTHRHRAIRWLLPLFCGLPVLDALLVWTNPAHQMVRSASHIVVYGDLSVLAYTYGPWFWFFVAYIYLGTLVAVGVLAVAFVRASRATRLHMSAIIVGMLAPLASGMFTVSGLIPLPELDHLDVSPLTYLLIAPLWTWALFRHRLLDLMPIARNRLVEAMLDGVLVVDAHGRIADCNESAHALLHDTDTPCIGTSAKALLPGLLLIDEPTRIRTKGPRAATLPDAEQTWLEIRSTPLYDKRQHLVGWLVVLHDQTEHWQMERALRQQNAQFEQEIAERKQAEEALRTSEARFAAFMDYLPGSAFIHDQHGRILFANRVYCQHLGASSEDVIGQPFRDVLPAHLADYFHDQDQQVLASGQVGSFEDHAEINGQKVTFMTTKFLVQTDDEVYAIGGVSFDITERKQAEEALRTSEARLKAIFDNAAVGIGLTDNAGKSIAVNARGAQQLGYTLEEMAHLSNLELTHPDDRAATVELVQQLLRGEIAGYRIEKRYFRKDGSILWADLSVSPVYADNGQITYLLGIVVDITERKQAEEALRASEQFVQQITTTVPDIVYIYDLNLQSNIYSNRQMTDILGYSPAEVQAMGSNVMATLVHPDDLPRVLDHLRHAADIHGVSNTVGTLEYRMRHRDGQWRWLLSREVVFMRTNDGQPWQLLGIAHDITERKQAEEALRASEQFVQQIATMIPGILYVYDLTLQRNIYSNRQIWQVLGYTDEEVQKMGSRMMPTLLHPDDLLRLEHHIMQHEEAEEGTIVTHEYRMRHRDGQWRWLLSYEVVFTRTVDGKPQQILGIAQDITERKQLEQQIQDANALLKEQAIRDPLTGLYNRRYLDEMVSREVQRAERHEQPFGVIMLDIDHFKQFNDSYGHDAGDALLRAIGAFLKSHSRGEDVACRYGGEEFILVLSGASLTDTRQRAEDLWTGIQALVVEHKGQFLDSVTVSLGVAVFPQHGTTGYAVIQAADRALYQAKHHGRNHVVAAAEEHSTLSE